MPNGFIKSWRRDRGFGFINVEGQDTDVFVHISELRDLGRPPRVGDEISFSVETQENGKVRAINCKVKGGNTNSNNGASNDKGNNMPIIITAISIAIIIGLGFYFFSK